MPRSHLAAVLFLCLTACRLEAQALSDWPQFRGPGGQGISNDTGVPVTWGPKENIAWKVDLPGGGASSPIVFGGHVYVTAFTGKGDAIQLHLLALDRATGQRAWSKVIAPRLPERPSMRENHGYASSTPAADAAGVYCYFGKSGAVAFDHDGNERWRSDLGSDVHEWGSAASPVLYGDLVIINASVEGRSIVALDKKTGKEVWREPGNREDAWNTPILVPLKSGRTELALAMGGKILGLDPKTGKQLWFCRTDIGWYMVPGLVTADDVIYAVGGRSGITSMAVRAGGQGEVTRSHRLWTSKKGSNVSSPIIHEGHLYWMNDVLGIAYSAVAATGEVVHEERVSSGIYSSPVLAEGRLYYVARNGRTHVLSAKPKFEQLATNDLGEQRIIFNSSPAVAGGRLYLRTDKYLYCIGRK
jgi:outer membrane protein assembly factor BamB